MLVLDKNLKKVILQAGLYGENVLVSVHTVESLYQGLMLKGVELTKAFEPRRK